MNRRREKRDKSERTGMRQKSAMQWLGVEVISWEVRAGLRSEGGD